MDINAALWEVVRAVADNDCTCSIELADTMGCIFDCGGRVDFENYPDIRFLHTETCPAMKARAIIEYCRTGKEPKPQGDPTCEQCHGQGCSQCNDEMWYAQEDAADQYRRDRAYDRSGQTGYRVS